MESITLQYPTWYILLCILLGVVYALFQYYRNPDFADLKKLSWILGITRCLVVGLIAFLLLGPIIRSLQSDVRKPVIIIGLDQSQSVGIALSPEQRTALLNEIGIISSRFSDEHHVIVHPIGREEGDTLTHGFNGQKTDISAFFTEIEQTYAHAHLGAIVLVSDGIYNQGQNPLYGLDRLNVPVYTVCLGDTSLSADASVRNIFHNEVAFLGDRFQIEVDIQASNLPGKTAAVSLLKFQDGRFIKSSNASLDIKGDEAFYTLPFEIQAETPGIERYQVAISEIRGEKNLRNNSREFFIDVLDSRQKILVLREAPHPDITALKQILTSSDIYEVTVCDLDEANEHLGMADIVILHGLPSQRRDISSLINKMDVLRLPRLFIMSTQSSPARLASNQKTILINKANGSINEVQAVVNPMFDFFEVDSELGNAISDYPPLLSPFGDYVLLGGATTLAHQKIGQVITSYPVLAFSEKQGVKEGILAGEGLWRWRLADFLKTGRHDQVDALVKKMIQYLSVKANKENFRVKAIQNIFEEGEHVRFTAELYNNAFEKVNDPEVDLTIRSSSGEAFNYIFSRTDEAYQLDAGILDPGDYRYSAKVTIGGKTLTKNGSFAVKAIDLEYYNTVADHQLLRSISEKMGGRSYGPSDWRQLAEDVIDSQIKAEVVYTTRTRSAQHYKWIFAILLLLLSGEWFLRRYFGRY